MKLIMNSVTLEHFHTCTWNWETFFQLKCQGRLTAHLGLLNDDPSNAFNNSVHLQICILFTELMQILQRVFLLITQSV